MGISPIAVLLLIASAADGFLLGIHDSHRCASVSMSHGRHCRTSLNSATSISMLFNATTLIEDTVRTVTSNPEYRFGDLTKGAISELSGKDASEYQFGDISKRLAGDAQDGLTNAVTSFTGEKDYKFGDITKKVLGDADQAIADARDAYFEELPAALWRQMFDGLSPNQRTDLFVSLVQLAAVVLLSYSLIANLSLMATMSVAWAVASSLSGLSPLTSAADWSSLLSVHATLRLVVDPALFPLRVLAAILITPTYRKVVSGLQRKLPLRDSQPVLNRALSVALAWLAVNVGATALVGALGVWLGAAVTRVPMFAMR